VTEHAGLIDAIRLAIRDEPCVLWPNNSGVAHHADGSRVRYGVPPTGGGADLLGLVDGGRFVGLEIKTWRDPVRPLQQLWLDLVLSLGGYATVIRARTEDEAAALALAAIREARRR
jgi:hypothetical protein